MNFLRYVTLTMSLALASCGGENGQEREQEEQVLIEEGITYTRTDEGFSLSSDVVQGFEFTYTHSNQRCLYENGVDPANKRMYTDNGCDGSIDSTLFVDCSDPDSCIILNVNEDVQQRDLEQITEVRERLRVNHYRRIWQEANPTQRE